LQYEKPSSNASDETFARMANMGVSTVSRCRKELIKHGLILVTERVGEPYIIRINFYKLRKANEQFWDTHDIMGLPNTPTPVKMNEGVGQNERGGRSK
jgi:hypothetical protein